MYSCSGSECKELLASLGGCEVAQALDDPALVVALTKFRQRAPQFLHVVEYPDPQQLLFQRANEPFDATVSFRLAHERRRRLHAQVSDFSLVVVAHVLAAVVVPVAIGAIGHRAGVAAQGSNSCPLRASRTFALLADCASLEVFDQLRRAGRRSANRTIAPLGKRGGLRPSLAWGDRSANLVN